MDSGRFVRLSVLAAPASRRAVTRGLAGVMAGSVLAPLIGHARVEAKKKVWLPLRLWRHPVSRGLSLLRGGERLGENQYVLSDLLIPAEIRTGQRTRRGARLLPVSVRDLEARFTPCG
jgi:hypothetical protein